ncbi:MAG: rhomboid family intramembrane serine protease [Muribaculaceae bacterium]|nr:rhomboid family intramembrane serine protease [Muribaculaceae bacterium]
MAIIDDIRRRYLQGTILLRIIYINVAVFLLLTATLLIAFLLGWDAQVVLKWIELPSQPHELLHKPWTLITYMYAHHDVWHILFNMLWLYWLGRIFTEYFTEKQLNGLYLLGGLGGGALYLIAYNMLPAFSGTHGYLVGASAAVMAIVVGIAIWAPNYKISLLFLGDISLKWVAIITVFIDMLNFETLNAGGHLAHLGGALVGAFFALSMRRGVDITRWLNATLDAAASLFRPRRRGPGTPIGGTAWRKQTQAPHPHPTEAEVDAVLDKIKRSGYGSLTASEREILFNASRTPNN